MIFEVLPVIIMLILVLCIVTPYSLIGGHQCFEKAFHLCPQDIFISSTRLHRITTQITIFNIRKYVYFEE